VGEQKISRSIFSVYGHYNFLGKRYPYQYSEFVSFLLVSILLLVLVNSFFLIGNYFDDVMLGTCKWFTVNCREDNVREIQMRLIER